MISRLLLKRLSFGKPLRTTMTILGITLGVATAISVGVVRDSLEGAFVQLMDELAGQATIQIGGDAVPVDASLLDEVRQVDGVESATASIMLMVQLADKKDAAFLLAGIDVLDEQSASQFKSQGDDGGLSDLDPVVFLNSRFNVLLSQKLAARHGLKVDQEIGVITPSGKVTLKIRGFLADTGPAKVFGGNYAMMYLDAAQVLFQREDTVDRIDIVTRKKLPVEPIIAAIRAKVGDRAKVERPDRRGARMDDFLATLDVGILLLSLVAVFVGMFLVFNTVSTSVAERRRDIGVLRALGMSRRGVLWWFTLEAGMLGAVGSSLGVPLGVAMAKVALRLMQRQVQLILPLDLSHTFTQPLVLAAAWLMGVIAAIAAAVWPARQAAHVSPREAIGQGGQVSQMKDTPRWLTVTGLAFLAVGSLSFFPPMSEEPLFVYGCTVLVVLSQVCLVPALSSALARGLSFYVPKLFGVHGRLASEHLTRVKGLTAVTVAALAVGMSLSVASASVTKSFKATLSSLLDQMLPADLFIHAGARTVGNMNTLMPQALRDELAQVEGVQAAGVFRMIPYYLYQDKPVALVANTSTLYLAHNPPLEQGELLEMTREVPAGRAAMVSGNFAKRFGMSVGSPLHLDSPSGTVTLKVAGIYTDFVSPNGAILIDQKLYAEKFKDTLIDSFNIFLTDQRNADAVRDRIATQFGQRHQFLILKNEELRGDLLKLIEQTFVLVYAQELIAILVAVLGILNAMLVAVMGRTREIGVLRAQGLTRRELMKVILIEAGLIGLMGSLLGALFGTMLAYQNVKVIVPYQTGWVFQFSLGWAAALMVGALCTGSALLAGLYPARKAALMPIREALSYE